MKWIIRIRIGFIFLFLTLTGARATTGPIADSRCEKILILIHLFFAESDIVTQRTTIGSRYICCHRLFAFAALRTFHPTCTRCRKMMQNKWTITMWMTDHQLDVLRQTWDQSIRQIKKIISKIQLKCGGGNRIASHKIKMHIAHARNLLQFNCNWNNVRRQKWNSKSHRKRINVYQRKFA